MLPALPQTRIYLVNSVLPFVDPANHDDLTGNFGQMFIDKNAWDFHQEIAEKC